MSIFSLKSTLITCNNCDLNWEGAGSEGGGGRGRGGCFLLLLSSDVSIVGIVARSNAH